MNNPRNVWPPLLCWEKWKLAKHPREAKGDRSLLLWRNAKALAIPMAVSAEGGHLQLPLLPFIEEAVQPITQRAFEIYEHHAGAGDRKATLR